MIVEMMLQVSQGQCLEIGDPFPRPNAFFHLGRRSTGEKISCAIIPIFLSFSLLASVSPLSNPLLSYPPSLARL